jgi:YidC/Oxa1 family membrane protein insertase
MDDQNKNLLLATVLSFVVILAWFFLFPPPEPAPPAEQPAATADGIATAPPVAGGAVEQPVTPEAARTAVLGTTDRIRIDTPRLSGSISLLGGRIDDLALKDYRETLAPGSDIVTLLSPVGTPGAQYALYGWVPGGALGFDDVPGANTPWEVESGEILTPETPVTLRWENGGGLVFRRNVSVDRDFLFSISQSVENTGTEEARLAPYGIIARHGLPPQMNFFILHEGVVKMADGKLTEIDYDDMDDMPIVEREAARAEVTEVAQNGWVGFTDHYWMSALIPAPGSAFTAVDEACALGPTSSRPRPAFRCDGRGRARAPAPRSRCLPAPRNGRDPRLPERTGHRPLPRLDRLGLVLLPDEADLLGAALAQRADRQHGPCDHRADPRHQGSCCRSPTNPTSRWRR